MLRKQYSLNDEPPLPGLDVQKQKEGLAPAKSRLLLIGGF